MSFRMFSSVKLTIIQNISLKLSLFGLKPVILSSKQHDDDNTKHEESQYKEEPEEVLDIMPEVAAIILLEPFSGILPFLCNHAIDLTDMFLHLREHPLMLLVEHFLDGSHVLV